MRKRRGEQKRWGDGGIGWWGEEEPGNRQVATGD